MRLFNLNTIIAIVLWCNATITADNRTPTAVPADLSHGVLQCLPLPLPLHLPLISCKELSTQSKYKFGGSRLHYYSNCTSTFQLKLLVSGDVNPNPGPATHECPHDGSHDEGNRSSFTADNRLVYDRSFLLQVQHENLLSQQKLPMGHLGKHNVPWIVTKTDLTEVNVQGEGNNVIFRLCHLAVWMDIDPTCVVSTMKI